MKTLFFISVILLVLGLIAALVEKYLKDDFIEHYATIVKDVCLISGVMLFLWLIYCVIC